jgi:hypothetical protein
METASPGHDYPPADWTADEIASALQAHPTAFPVPSYTETDRWEAIKTAPINEPHPETIQEKASENAEKAIPQLSASLFLEYHRSGNRTTYHEPYLERRERLTQFLIAECLQREGEYLDDVLDYAWALCEQSAWILPAHLDHRDQWDQDGLPAIVDEDDRYIALVNASMARRLAALDYILGDELHEALRDRIRYEVDRRVFTPYEARSDFGWFSTPAGNWNAVCNASVAIAALYLLDDIDRQAAILKKATSSLEGYLEGFGSDGATTEGLSYWNYGFGHYTQLAAVLHARTEGAYSLQTPPILTEISRYPTTIELSPGNYVTFSDTHHDNMVDPFTTCWLGQHLDLPALAASGRRTFKRCSWSDLHPNGFGLLALEWVKRTNTKTSAPSLPQRSYLPAQEWWIARASPEDPDGPVVAAKAGHNDEMHNHNDVGTVIYHHGQENRLTDFGSDTYTAEYFGESRYEHLATRSLGHNVPLVNDTEQRDGEDYAATAVRARSGEETETFSMDIAGAYPEAAGLNQLERRLQLDLRTHEFTITDEATFETSTNTFREVFVSFDEMESAADGFLVRSAENVYEVSADPVPDDVQIEHIPEGVREDDVWRSQLCYRPDDDCRIQLHVAEAKEAKHGAK